MALIFRTPRASCAEAPDGRTGSAACDTEIYRRFAETLVTYTVELAQDRTVSDAARAAFRTSASDVIPESSSVPSVAVSAPRLDASSSNAPTSARPIPCRRRWDRTTIG